MIRSLSGNAPAASSGRRASIGSSSPSRPSSASPTITAATNGLVRLPARKRSWGRMGVLGSSAPRPAAPLQAPSPGARTCNTAPGQFVSGLASAASRASCSRSPSSSSRSGGGVGGGARSCCSRPGGVSVCGGPASGVGCITQAVRATARTRANDRSSERLISYSSHGPMGWQGQPRPPDAQGSCGGTPDVATGRLLGGGTQMRRGDGETAAGRRRIPAVGAGAQTEPLCDAYHKWGELSRDLVDNLRPRDGLGCSEGSCGRIRRRRSPGPVHRPAEGDGPAPPSSPWGRRE